MRFRRASKSSFRQLEFDAAIATEGVLRRASINGLKLAEAGSDQPGWLHALANHVLHHRDCSFRREIPIGFKLANDWPHIGVAVNAQYPGNLSRDLAL